MQQIEPPSKRRRVADVSAHGLDPAVIKQRLQEVTFVPDGEVDDTRFEKLATWFADVCGVEDFASASKLTMVEPRARTAREQAEQDARTQLLLSHGVLQMFEVGLVHPDCQVQSCVLRMAGAFAGSSEAAFALLAGQNGGSQLLDHILAACEEDGADVGVYDDEGRSRRHVAGLYALAHMCSYAQGRAWLLHSADVVTIARRAFVNSNFYVRSAACHLLAELVLWGGDSCVEALEAQGLAALLDPGKLTRQVPEAKANKQRQQQLQPPEARGKPVMQVNGDALTAWLELLSLLSAAPRGRALVKRFGMLEKCVSFLPLVDPGLDSSNHPQSQVGAWKQCGGGDVRALDAGLCEAIAQGLEYVVASPSPPSSLPSQAQANRTFLATIVARVLAYLSELSQGGMDEKSSQKLALAPSLGLPKLDSSYQRRRHDVAMQLAGALACVSSREVGAFSVLDAVLALLKQRTVAEAGSDEVVSLLPPARQWALALGKLCRSNMEGCTLKHRDKGRELRRVLVGFLPAGQCGQGVRAVGQDIAPRAAAASASSAVTVKAALEALKALSPGAVAMDPSSCAGCCPWTAAVSCLSGDLPGVAWARTMACAYDLLSEWLVKGDDNVLELPERTLAELMGCLVSHLSPQSTSQPRVQAAASLFLLRLGEHYQQRQKLLQTSRAIEYLVTSRDALQLLYARLRRSGGGNDHTQAPAALQAEALQLARALIHAGVPRDNGRQQESLLAVWQPSQLDKKEQHSNGSGGDSAKVGDDNVGLMEMLVSLAYDPEPLVPISALRALAACVTQEECWQMYSRAWVLQPDSVSKFDAMFSHLVEGVLDWEVQCGAIKVLYCVAGRMLDEEHKGINSLAAHERQNVNLQLTMCVNGLTTRTKAVSRVTRAASFSALCELQERMEAAPSKAHPGTRDQIKSFVAEMEAGEHGSSTLSMLRKCLAHEQREEVYGPPQIDFPATRGLESTLDCY